MWYALYNPREHEALPNSSQHILVRVFYCCFESGREIGQEGPKLAKARSH